MKIAEPESIKAGEQELINSIMEQLNAEIIGSIASGRLAVNNLEFRNGDMVIHKNRIVYKMEFETSVAVSVLFDREGNLIDEDEDSSDAPPLEANESSEEILEMADQEVDISMLDAETPAGLEHSEDGEENQMNLVMEKTREFWLQRSRDAANPEVSAPVEDGEGEFHKVMQKNREFWQTQAANNSIAE